MRAHDPGEPIPGPELLRIVRRARELVDQAARELPEWDVETWRGPAADAANARGTELRVAVTSAMAILDAVEHALVVAGSVSDG